MGDAIARDDLLLACSPGKEGDTLVFECTVVNDGAVPAYVMDALPVTGPDGRPALDAEAATLWLDADGVMTILRGVAAMPEGLDPQARVMPLAVKLAPGERLHRRLVQRLPLAERSPYAPEGHLRDYRLVPIQGVAVAVDAIAADAPGFTAVKAAGYPAGHFRLVPEEDVLNLRRLSCAFRTRGLFALVRLTDYPRPG